MAAQILSRGLCCVRGFVRSAVYSTYHSVFILTISTPRCHSLSICQLRSSSCHFHFIRAWGSPANAFDPVQVRLVFDLEKCNRHHWVLSGVALVRPHTLNVRQDTCQVLQDRDSNSYLFLENGCSSFFYNRIFVIIKTSKQGRVYKDHQE